MPEMSLLDLPNELLYQISENLDTAQDIASLSRVNHHLHQLTAEHLYQFDARERNSSALVWAADHGHLETAEKALKAVQKDDQLPDDTSAEPTTNPIDVAFVHAADNGHVGVARLFIERGASFRWRDNEQRQSAMEAACFKGHIEVVKLLLESGANSSGGHYLRPYPIHCAAIMGHTDIVQVLIDAGASADTCTGRPAGGSYPPLQLAVRGGHEDTVMLLINKGAKINLRIRGMHTALEEAVRGNHLWAVKLLLESGAKVFAPASGVVRCPALQMARKPGREEIYKLLKDQPVYLWPREDRVLAQDGSAATRVAQNLRSQEGIPPHLRRSERILRKRTA
jgi:ankyrin repeat protein